MTYALKSPHIACSISMQKHPEAKGTNCVKFKKFCCNITAVGMAVK